MAGIGFELRKLLNKRSYAGVLQAYAYAGLISSGPMVLSIVGMVLISVLSFGVVIPHILISQFQITVTYIYFSSLILTGPVQLSFTRFISDRLYVKDEAAVLPNFNGLLFLVINVSILLALPVALFGLGGQTAMYRLLFVMG
ncbi:MAG: exopolysaccharide Pel transporter PelG, partial [Pseudomonadota bacterium]|nr:exopolysaccharide Pel transporter PelG [Pseudomonadota bacterium]